MLLFLASTTANPTTTAIPTTGPTTMTAAKTTTEPQPTTDTEPKTSNAFTYSKPTSKPAKTTSELKVLKDRYKRKQFIVQNFPGNIVVLQETPPKTDLPDYYTYIKSSNSTYYITAQVREKREIAIGDGRVYGGYYNAPLEPGSTYRIFTRMVHEKKNGKLYYGKANGTVVFKTPEIPTRPSVSSNNWIKSNKSIVTVVVSTTIVIILIIVIIVMIVVFIRKKKKEKPKEDENAYMTVDEVKLEMKSNKTKIVDNTIEMTTHYQKAVATGHIGQGHYEGLNLATRKPQEVVQTNTERPYASLDTSNNQQYEPLQLGGEDETSTYEVVDTINAPKSFGKTSVRI